MLALAACHSPQRQARQMVRLAERLFDTMPDSTASLIDSVLRMPVYFGEKQRMDMALLQGEALFGDRDRDISPLMDDEFFDDKDRLTTSPELERAAAYYARKKQYDKAAHAALYSGFVQQHYGEKAAAMQSFKEAEHYGELAGDSLAVARAEYKMGKLLYKDDLEQEAILLLKRAEIGFKEQYAEKALTENLIAICYSIQGDYDNSEICLRQSLLNAEKANCDKVKGKTLNNFAVLYRLQGKYDQALDCLRQAIDKSDDSKLFLNYLNMGKVFDASGELDSALYYYQRIEDLLPIVDVKNETKVSAYGALSKFAESQNNDTQALKYRKAHESLLFEMMRQRQEQAVYRIQKQYDYESLQNSLNRKIILRHRIIIVISILLFISSIIILLLQYRHKQLLEEESMMKRQIDTMKQELRHSHQVLQQRAMNLYKTESDKAWERIVADFETAYPQAMENLKAAYPELTDTECNIVILSFLGFRMKEEAELLHLSLHTVAKYRTNIRKKVGSSSISNLFS